MNQNHHFHRLLFFFLIAIGMAARCSSLGCNWGLRATHPLPPETVVKLMKDNGFNQVKLFEADHRALKELENSDLQVMVGIPNEMLDSLAKGTQAAVSWVTQNVSAYVSRGVDIRYVAVGNEPFLKTYQDEFIQTTFPALQNVQAALIKAGLATKIKVTVPLNADIYETDNGVPSGGDFRADIKDLMVSIVKFLSDNKCPLTVNIYPFLSLNADPNFPVDYAFFDGTTHPVVDGSVTYTNVFDANFDTLISALEKNGFGSMPVIVGEVGWPTDADPNANVNNARRFNQGLINRAIQGKGTPKRSTPPDIYVFSLIDEDAKSIEPGNFERHWGIFYYDGSIKYQLDMGSSNKSLVPAKGVNYLARKWCVMAPQASLNDPNFANSVSYACQFADCTSLGPGSSCGQLDSKGNASYAFNMYYQTMNQTDQACKFNNLATITTKDPSQGSCKFEIQIDISKEDHTSQGARLHECSMFSVMILLILLFHFAMCNFL